MHSKNGPHLRPSGRVAICSFALALVACSTPDASETEVPTLAGPARSLSAPTGHGSGEASLTTTAAGPLLSWIDSDADSGPPAFRVATWSGEAWSDPVTVVSDPAMLVNWADFPAVREIDGVLYGHWLERGEQGGYDYGVRIVTSVDGGRSWTSLGAPHEDGTPTEHGFVSAVPHPGGGAALVWLDGRRYQTGPEGGAPTEEMTLRSRRVDAAAFHGEESELVDARVCDCCQTDAAWTREGPIVAYRDRSPDEVRDIRLVRWSPGGWTPGTIVHDDGWVTGACPVNGPAVDASGRRVVVAWYTAADDRPTVRAAFSDDGGATFGTPHRIDEGQPAGRVDTVLLDDGSALVSWIERTGEAGAALRVRRVSDGGIRPASTVSGTSASRAAGFPRITLWRDEVLVAWTEIGTDGDRRVRVAAAPLSPASGASR